MVMSEHDPTGIKGLARGLESLVKRPDPMGVKGLQAELHHLFRGRTKLREFPTTIRKLDTSPAEILLDENPYRLAWYLFNFSGNTIYVAFSARVASNHGIQLPSMSGVCFSIIEDPDIPPKEVWAVASADETSFYLFDVVEKEEEGCS